jgi:hypothetical protein
MGRPKSKSKSTEAAAEAATMKSSISKAEAVRQALAAGSDSPEEGVAYLLDHYGIVMDRQTFSSNKAQEKARQAKKAEAATASKPGRKPKAQSPAVQHHAGDSGDLLGTLEALKPLIAEHGASKLHRLVDLLG